MESFAFPDKIKMVELMSFLDGNYLPLAIFCEMAAKLQFLNSLKSSETPNFGLLQEKTGKT